MASGFFNALQAALAGVSGGAQGYSEYEAEQERRRRQAQSDLMSALAAGYEPPEGVVQEIELAGKRLKLTETPAAQKRREAAERKREAEERAELERERLQISRDQLAQQAEQARLGREAQVQSARISASAAASRDAAERQAKQDDRSQAGLSWYTTTMRDTGVPQATKDALGLAIAEAQARKGSTLSNREIGAVAADLMDLGASERKFRVSEAGAEMSSDRFPMGGQPLAPVYGGAAGADSPELQERLRDWKLKNPRRPDETTEQYAARMRSVFGGTR